MRYTVTHRTSFRYQSLASHAVNRACLTPRDTTQQQCLQSRVEIDPEPDVQQSAVDRFGNQLVLFDLAAPHNRADVTATSTVLTYPAPELPSDFTRADLRERLLHHTGADMLLAEECLLPSPQIPVRADPAALIAAVGWTPDSGVLDFAERLMNYIFNEFVYDPNYSSVATPIADVLEAQRGVCQDFAHAAILCCRKLGIAARYVSGYLETLPPEGVEKLRGSDASHAWFSVYDGVGAWYDFDPTNNKRPDEQYITTAWGRDYTDVAPLRGVVYGGGSQQLEVAVDVDRAKDQAVVRVVTT